MIQWWNHSFKSTGSVLSCCDRATCPGFGHSSFLTVVQRRPVLKWLSTMLTSGEGGLLLKDTTQSFPTSPCSHAHRSKPSDMPRLAAAVTNNRVPSSIWVGSTTKRMQVGMILAVVGGLSHAELGGLTGRTRQCREHHTARRGATSRPHTVCMSSITRGSPALHLLLVPDLTSTPLVPLLQRQCTSGHPLKNQTHSCLGTFAPAVPFSPKHLPQRSTCLAPFTLSGFTQMS